MQTLQAGERSSISSSTATTRTGRRCWQASTESARADLSSMRHRSWGSGSSVWTSASWSRQT